jgi:Domain of unknown function (DUF4189)
MIQGATVSLSAILANSIRYRPRRRVLLSFKVAVLFLVGCADQAAADCASMCESDRWACSENSDSSSCGTQFQICVQNCIGGEGSADNFGAIAFSSSTEIFGFSHDFDTRGAAENRAVSECRKAGGADDCQSVVWFNQTCGALASDGDGTYGADWAATRKEAKSKAKANCQKYTGKPCAIRKSLCAE